MRLCEASGLKRCPKCAESKPPLEFHVGSRNHDGLSLWCKACATAKQVVRRQGPGYREYQREWWLAHKYGITLKDYDRMLENQEGGCAICLRNPDDVGLLCVDHCHESGKVRGLLCAPCNRCLGHVGDDLVVLRRAVAYLERTS